MPRPLPKIGNREKALIHVAKSQLKMSEEDYRAVLGSVGAASSKDLNPVQFDEVMRKFKSYGFVHGGRVPGSGSRKRQPRPAEKDPRLPLLRKIAAILAATGLTDAYVDGISKKMFGIDRYGWLNQEQLWKVVAALSVYVKRKSKAGGGSRHKEEGT
jgi:phage gp16-like protein